MDEKDIQNLIELAESEIRQGVSKEEANAIKAQLEEAGAEIELQ